MRKNRKRKNRKRDKERQLNVTRESEIFVQVKSE